MGPRGGKNAVGGANTRDLLDRLRLAQLIDQERMEASIEPRPASWLLLYLRPCANHIDCRALRYEVVKRGRTTRASSLTLRLTAIHPFPPVDHRS